MAPVCHSFVQNAWKKDFCSNCFKSREEHVKQERNDISKNNATPFQNRTTYGKRTPPSILKLNKKKKDKQHVKFPEEVCSVIGYGGDDWSDDEEFEMTEDTNDESLFPDNEEERELHRLTKCNTDFNTVKTNLLFDGGCKSYTSLLLGKAETDSEGRKKTIKVTVTPYGQQNNNPIKTHLRKPAVIQVTDTITDDKANFKTNIILTNYIKDSETLVSCENSNNTQYLCTEKSLLEEISETLEKNRIAGGADINITDKKTTKPLVIKETMKESMQDMPDKKDANESKKNGLVRKSPLLKTQERPKVNVARSEFKFCKINIENNSVDSSVGTFNSTRNNSMTSDECFIEKTDSDNDDSGHFSETPKCDETVQIKLFDNDKNIDKRNVEKLDVAKTNTGYSTFQSPIIDMPPIIPKSESLFSADTSRELAGEPDGRADPDESSEAPALPNSPVPTIDPRPSFLHGMLTDTLISPKPVVPDKPKVPAKPVIKHTVKKMFVLPQNSHSQRTPPNDCNDSDMINDEKNNEITEVDHDHNESIYYAKPVLTKEDSDTSLNTLGKRKAPTPPSTPTVEEFPCNIYQRNPNSYVKSDSPIIREMEKRERASISLTPKMKTNEDINEIRNAESTPEPAPRKIISLSHDNLLIDDKRKGKLKFSIRKLLRIGSSKDLDKKELSIATVAKITSKPDEIYDSLPKPKPRLVIIHPLDINGSNVEVVKPNDILEISRKTKYEDLTQNFCDRYHVDSEITKIPKPAPPPRHSSDQPKSNLETSKPARPPPPKSIVLQKKQKQQTWTMDSSKNDSIYANLGEIRSALAPRKPERTASMREKEVQIDITKRRLEADGENEVDDESTNIIQATNEPVINNYDDVYNPVKYDDESCDSAKNSDSDYEYVHHALSSSPECDSNIKPRVDPDDRNVMSKGEIDMPLEFPKYNNALSRSSLPYCGSETESEIYSPYSFYNSNDAMDTPANEDFSNDITPKATTNKLRVRKGRSVVHRNLEDNYGAVVIANHEALAQVLEQVQQSATMPPSLRGLKACTNLRWTDFSISKSYSKADNVKAGKRVFCHAVWNSGQGPVNVTLMLHKEQMASQLVCQQSVQPQTLSLNAITEFCDLVPLKQFGEESDDLAQATIVVLAQAQVDTIQSYGEKLHATEGLNTKEYQLVQSEQIYEAIFMMLQLINGLKYLQARGVEEIPEPLTSFISLKEQHVVITHTPPPSAEDRLNSLSAPKTNCYGRLCILQGLNNEVKCNKATEEEHLNSLCKCALKAIDILLPGEKLTPLLKEILQEERAVSLNQAKSVLEFMLWGPLDVVQGVPVDERELSLQRWLDLERATVLHGLVRTRVQLNVFEQLHLMFLVRSTAKAMCDASVLLEKANVY